MTDSFGKYRLVEHLARGGMADIYLAEQEGPAGFNKSLVIKRILPALAADEQFTRMFLDEARLAAQLSHPKIAQIYELGEIEGSYFIAMEFIDGLNVAEIVGLLDARGEVLGVDLAVKVVMDLLEALDYAHDYKDRGGEDFDLVHRDVTPHNVMVSNDGIVKLCDFGVAKARANESQTQTGAVKGKFAYMAPEQIKKEPLDRRADLFAVGVLFYEMLTGRKPFGEDLAAVAAILGSERPDVRRERPEVPEAVAQVVDRALVKEREARYQDAHEMLCELEAYLRGEGNFVGDRELSTFIRELRGLPATRQSGQEMRVTPRDGRAPVHAPTADFDALPEEQETGPTTAASSEPRGITPGMVIGFMVLVLAILVAGGAVLVLVVSGGNDEAATVEKPAVVAKEKASKTGGERGRPGPLHHANGLIVNLSTTTPAEVWVDGEFVRKTPFQTTLRPGAYTIELRRDGSAPRAERIVVERGKPVQPFKFDY